MAGADDVQGSGTEGSAPGWLDLARLGDQATWEALYRGIYPRLRAYMYRRVGAENAEDAVSETMRRAVAGIHRYEPGPVGFDGWVFGIARRVAVDSFRADTRLRRQAEAGSRAQPGGPGAADLPEDAVVLEEEQARVREVFSLLSPEDREILELRIMAGLSHEEVAAVVGKKPGAVRTAQSRALARLRQLMEASDGR